MKKILSLFICVMMIVSCIACTKKEGGVAKEDPNKVPEEPYEINWYTYGPTLTDITSVEKEINTYLKDKINATLKINRLETAQYSKKLSTMMSAGEYFDLAFCAEWMLDYNINAKNGAFFAVDDYIKEYMPKTYELYDKTVLESAKVSGKIYALPVIKENSSQYGWIYRKDIADKYNINMAEIKNFEELEPVLEKIKANEPDMAYPTQFSGDGLPQTLIQFKNVAAFAGIFHDGTYPINKIVNLIDTPEYLKACETANRYYNKGLITKDILTNQNVIQSMKDGKIFCHIAQLKPGKVGEIYKNINFPLEQIGITPVKQDMLPGTGSMEAISRTSKNPVRVMRFLELLNTDEYLHNLVVYGIEGKHYVKKSDNVVEVMPNTQYSMADSQWMLSNVFLSWTTTEEDPEKYTKLKAFEKSAEKPVFNTFVFDTEGVSMEISSCKEVYLQFNKQIAFGVVEPKSILDEYKTRLKTAGIDKIMTKMQKQYDEFLKDKKY